MNIVGKLVIKETFLYLFSNIISTKRNTESVSFRRNGNYRRHFEWTYELNRDVYKCYTQARSDPRIGYMKRIKKHWDELHPDLSYFNEKQLRQQASFVESKDLILETNLKNYEEHSQQEISIQIDEDTTSNLENPTQSNEPNDENFDENLLNDLKIKFLYYQDIYKNLPPRERNFDTQVNYDIKGVELQVMNCIINHQKEIISLWTINVIQYSATISLLDSNNALKELTDKNEKIRPRWKVFLNNKINSIRRKISYITLIVNCRNTSSVLTKHQKKIENRLKKWFHNTKLRTLESKLSQLNHDLKLASESLRNKQKLCERNSINKKF